MTARSLTRRAGSRRKEVGKPSRPALKRIPHLSAIALPRDQKWGLALTSTQPKPGTDISGRPTPPPTTEWAAGRTVLSFRSTRPGVSIRLRQHPDGSATETRGQTCRASCDLLPASRVRARQLSAQERDVNERSGILTLQLQIPAQVLAFLQHADSDAPSSTPSPS